MTIKSINPATGKHIKDHKPKSSKDIKQMMQQSKKAQKKWAQTTLKQQSKLFQQLKENIKDQAPEILKLMQEETGKLIPDGEAEVYDVIDAIDYYTNHLKQLKSDTSLKLNPQAFPDTDLTINYVPHGVVGLIMPWNFPFYSPMMFVIAALMAGNSVLLKPSEYSTMVGQKISQLFQDAGFDPQLIQVVIGGKDTGKALVKAGCDKLSFVGSVAAGKDIIANAGITPVQVELGGNSAAIVLPDADLDLAVAGIAWGGTYHSGQDCVGTKRVIVHQEIAQDFQARLITAVKKLRPGTDYGPYIRDHARQEVLDRINAAVESGAKLLIGGEKIASKKGFWLSPAVLTYTDSSLKLVSEETFGNVLPIMVVKDEKQAIAEANNTHYGLSNSIYTQDLPKAEHIATQLESGMVFINDPFIAIPGWDHWTGWKESGFGTTEPKFMQMLKKKIISVNNKSQPRDFWYPYE